MPDPYLCAVSLHWPGSYQGEQPATNYTNWANWEFQKLSRRGVRV